MDIPGVLKLLELSACGREVTERAAEGALQKAKGLKWLRHCAWNNGKGGHAQGYLKGGLVMNRKVLENVPSSQEWQLEN